MSAPQQDPGSRKARSVEPRRTARRDDSPMFVVNDPSEAAAVGSPARAMQKRLSRAFDADATERWSGRRTLLFIVAVCGGFWLALYMALAALGR